MSAVDQIEGAEQNLYDLATTGSYEAGFRSLTEADADADAVNMAQAAFKRDGKTVGVPSGFTQLDLMLGGLHKSDLIVLAGRPSMGKTALATNIAFNVARSLGAESGDGAPAPPVVGFYSLEMSAEQLANRMVAEQTQIASDKIRRGELNESQFEKLVLRASRDLEGLAYFIDDTPALTVSALRTRARRLKRQHGLALLVVDCRAATRAGNRAPEAGRRARPGPAIPPASAASPPTGRDPGSAT